MGKMTVNGVSYDVPPGSSISVINGEVRIGGVLATNYPQPANVVVHITGDTGAVDAAGEVNISGSVKGKVKAGNAVHIKGDVEGDIDAGNGVECGNVTGNVDAGNSVRCGNVGGDIDAGGSVRRG